MFSYSDSQNTSPMTPGTSTATLATGSSVCISGKVGQITGSPPDYTDDWGCGVGINLNQAQGNMTTANTYALTGTGVTVTTSAVPSCTSARVILDEGGVTYCAALTSGVLIPWTTFNTACWDNSGTALTGAPTSKAIKIQFVASTTASCTFSNFCITQVSL